MKALIIVTVLAMATSAIEVPLSRQAQAALLPAMQDNAHGELDRESATIQEEAETEGMLSDIGGFLKKLDPAKLRDGLRLLNDGEARVQGKDKKNKRNPYLGAGNNVSKQCKCRQGNRSNDGQQGSNEKGLRLK